MSKKLKILYAAGPGNVIETFHYWNQGQDDPSQVSMTFSGQFYDVCTALDAEGYLIASHPEKQFLQHGRFTLEHRPMPCKNRSGILYYLGQIYYQLKFIASALKFQSDVAIASDTSCFFVLSLLPKLGIQVIPSLHCVLWSKYTPLRKSQKILATLNRPFFSKDCLAILSTSADINQQIEQLTDRSAVPIINFLSTYRQTEFEEIEPANLDQPTFNVLFAGRIEVDKGVFDLLEVAKRFQAENRTHIVFHVCGVGTALESLTQQVVDLGLQSSFILYGYCQKPKMRQMFGLAHVVVVPTQSSFVEGLNQVVIESVLAHRPVITSAICPALKYIAAAAIEVPPDDVPAYGDAILQLQENRALYQEKQQQCQRLQAQFYDLSSSWGEALKSILVTVTEESPSVAAES